MLFFRQICINDQRKTELKNIFCWRVIIFIKLFEWLNVDVQKRTRTASLSFKQLPYSALTFPFIINILQSIQYANRSDTHIAVPSPLPSFRSKSQVLPFIIFELLIWPWRRISILDLDCELGCGLKRSLFCSFYFEEQMKYCIRKGGNRIIPSPPISQPLVKRNQLQPAPLHPSYPFFFIFTLLTLKDSSTSVSCTI